MNSCWVRCSTLVVVEPDVVPELDVVPGGLLPELLADARFVLAKALWSDKTQRSRARALAEQARDAYAKAGEGRIEYLAEAEAWLAEHRVR